MATTGVGGIKDSQGNYEIVGKSNSTLGTRGGTLLVPVGDVIGQTSGTLLSNVYTATTLGNASAVSVNVQAFTPASPPTPASVFSSLSMGVESGGSSGSFSLSTFSTGAAPKGVVEANVDATVGDYTRIATSSSGSIIHDGFNQYPVSAGTNSSITESFFLIVKTSSGAGTRTLIAPCDGTFTDAVCLINVAASDVLLKLNGVTVCTLAATADFVRRSTGFSLPASSDPVVDFVKGDTITIQYPATPINTRSILKIFYIRTGSVL